MLIDMLPHSLLLPVQKCIDGKGPTDCGQSSIFWIYKGVAQDGDNYQGLKSDAVYRDNYQV